MLNCNLISVQKGANPFIALVITSLLEAVSPVVLTLIPCSVILPAVLGAQLRVRCPLAHSESKIEFAKSLH